MSEMAEINSLVTVIIPNYNGLSFLKACIAALRVQKYKRFDILVVDNGSEDGSVEWLQSQGIWAPQIKELTLLRLHIYCF